MEEPREFNTWMVGEDGQLQPMTVPLVPMVRPYYEQTLDEEGDGSQGENDSNLPQFSPIRARKKQRTQGCNDILGINEPKTNYHDNPSPPEQKSVEHHKTPNDANPHHSRYHYTGHHRPPLPRPIPRPPPLPLLPGNHPIPINHYPGRGAHSEYHYHRQWCNPPRYVNATMPPRSHFPPPPPPMYYHPHHDIPPRPTVSVVNPTPCNADVDRADRQKIVQYEGEMKEDAIKDFGHDMEEETSLVAKVSDGTVEEALRANGCLSENISYADKVISNENKPPMQEVANNLHAAEWTKEEVRFPLFNFLLSVLNDSMLLDLHLMRLVHCKMCRRMTTSTKQLVPYAQNQVRSVQAATTGKLSLNPFQTVYGTNVSNAGSQSSRNIAT